MDETAQSIEERLQALEDRFAIYQIVCGYGYPGLFAAYNAGPGRYAEHLASGRPLPAETRAYVAALAGGTGAVSQPVRRLTPDERFAPVWRAPPGAGVAAGAIFFPLRTQGVTNAGRRR